MKYNFNIEFTSDRVLSREETNEIAEKIKCSINITDWNETPAEMTGLKPILPELIKGAIHDLNQVECSEYDRDLIKSVINTLESQL